MKPGERDYLYLSKDKDGKWEVTNWPGTFRRPIFNNRPQKGNHNFARTRYDVWFKVGENFFHGVQYGDFTQVCHIKCLKP